MPNVSLSSVDGAQEGLNVPWGLRDIFWVCIYSFLLFFVLYFWASLLLVLVWRFSGLSFSFLNIVHAAFLFDQDSFFLMILFYMALWIALDQKIFKKYKIDLMKHFFRKEKLLKDAFYGAKVYLQFLFVVVSAFILLNILFQVFDMIFNRQSLLFFETLLEADHRKQLLENVSFSFSSVAVLLILAPFLEEVIFRGCFYGALRIRFSKIWSILISSFIFAFLHGYLFLFIYIFVVGILLANLYEKRRSLTPALVFHALNNLTGLLVITSTP